MLHKINNILYCNVYGRTLFVCIILVFIYVKNTVFAKITIIRHYFSKKSYGPTGLTLTFRGYFKPNRKICRSSCSQIFPTRSKTVATRLLNIDASPCMFMANVWKKKRLNSKPKI